MKVDELDRRILHLLALDGRSSFRALAAATGVSAQTAQRRFARLATEFSVRVVGRTYPTAVGDDEWFVRLRCRPGTAHGLARALARHTETEWVHVLSGGAEILCTTRHHHDQESDVLQRLPQTSGVTSVVAQCLLHTYFGGPQTPLIAPSDPGGPGGPAADGPVALTRLDRALLDALHEDGRIPNQELARAAGCSPATAHRRVADLRHHGVLYLDLDYDPAVVDRRRITMLWLTVSPGSLGAAARALAGHRETSLVATTTGPTNLYAVAITRGNAELHDYLTDSVGALPGLIQLESAPVARTAKRTGRICEIPTGLRHAREDPRGVR